MSLFSKYITKDNSDTHATLDSLMDRIQFPAVVKLDIEGGESDALLGARALLAHPKVRWIVEIHSKALETECLETFKSHGYETKVINDAWWRIFIPEQRPAEHNNWMVAYR